jgi:hypothetical protein
LRTETAALAAAVFLQLSAWKRPSFYFFWAFAL